MFQFVWLLVQRMFFSPGAALPATAAEDIPYEGSAAGMDAAPEETSATATVRQWDEEEVAAVVNIAETVMSLEQGVCSIGKGEM